MEKERLAQEQLANKKKTGRYNLLLEEEEEELQQELHQNEMAMAQQALDQQFQAVEFPPLASSASTGRSTVTSWATMAANVAHLPVPIKVATVPVQTAPKTTPAPKTAPKPAPVNNNDNIRWADDDDYDDDDYADIDHAMYLEQQAFDALPAQQTYLQFLLDGNDDGAW
jgi:hypothetical protein